MKICKHKWDTVSFFKSSKLKKKKIRSLTYLQIITVRANICAYCFSCNKTPQIGQKYISNSSGGWNSEMRMPVWPNDLISSGWQAPNSPPPHTITLVIKISMDEFWGNVKIQTIANGYIICRTLGKMKMLGLLFKNYIFQYGDRIALSQVGNHPE